MRYCCIVSPKFPGFEIIETVSEIYTMAKKKSSPKSKSASKKSCDKKCSKKKCEQIPQENKDVGFEVKPLSKQDLFFGLIKKVFGYE
jgi:hypothetical protein